MLFFLHLADGDHVLPDQYGSEFEDLDAAIREANKSAAELICDRLHTGEGIEGFEIRIASPSGRILHTVKLVDVAKGGSA